MTPLLPKLRAFSREFNSIHLFKPDPNSFSHERIRYTCKFDDPNLAGGMQTTITLKKVSCGAEIDIVQEGIPNVIPTDSPSVNAAVTFGLE
jgi:hypothetical protein